MDNDQIRALAKEIYNTSSPLQHEFEDRAESEGEYRSECKLCGVEEDAVDAEGLCEVAQIELIINVILRMKNAGQTKW